MSTNTRSCFCGGCGTCMIWQRNDEIEDLKGKLKAAQDLLLERARQAEELIAIAAELRGVVNLYLRHEGPGTKLTCSQLVEIAEKRMALTPAAALDLQRARRAVVDAAKDFLASYGYQIQTRPEVKALADAVVALEKLEAPPC